MVSDKKRGDASPWFSVLKWCGVHDDGHHEGGLHNAEPLGLAAPEALAEQRKARVGDVEEGAEEAAAEADDDEREHLPCGVARAGRARAVG